MTISTFTSRQFNQAASEAKKAADDGPVFITDRGRPAHVLMSIDLYRRLTGSNQKIADLLAMSDSVEGTPDLDLPRPRDLARPADLS